MLTSTKTLRFSITKLFSGNFCYYCDNTQFITSDFIYPNSGFFREISDRLYRREEELHILDASDEPWREVLTEQLDSEFVKYKIKKYLILSHSLKYYKNFSCKNILYFPHCYFDGVLNWNQDDAVQNVNLIDRPYFLSCLNRQPKLTRIYNWLNLRKKSYADTLLLSMYNLKDNNVQTIAGAQYSDEWLDNNDLAEWENIKNQLPSECENDLGIGHPAYHHAYINLVTETFVQPGELFLSEKIYKPLACGQLFIVLGNPGVVAYLRHLGFDTFDDIIDHSKYDNIRDWRQRTDIIHSMLDDLQKLDWQTIYRDTSLRRLHNSRLFFTGLAIKPHMEELASAMSEIHGQPHVYDHNFILNLHQFNHPAYKFLPKINRLFNN